MSEQIIEILELITRGLEIISASLLSIGFVVATVRWVQQLIHDGKSSALKNYREALGRVILIGLEVIVAATILKTITDGETIKSLTLLVLMVSIRTILGWAMVLEMTGRWPWQKPKKEKMTANDAST